MNYFINSYAVWLADFYLLSTLLLLVAIAGLLALRQPAHRMAIVKATFVALALLAALCALPRWSVVHLLIAEIPPTPTTPHHAPLAAAPIVHTMPIAAIEQAAVNSNIAQPALESAKAPTPSSWSWPTIDWITAIIIAHIIGSIMTVAWLIAGNIAARRLRRASTPARPSLIEVLNGLTVRQNSPAPRVELLGNDRIHVPVALGIHHPAILLPASFAEFPSESRMPKSEIESVLAHELAHIRHRDLHWLAASRALMIALWAQPLFWYLRRRMRLDQETLADAAAAELTSREQYAEQLVAWARNLVGRPSVRVASAVGLWEGPSQLRQRIALLLNDRFSVLRNCSARWRNSSFIACLVLALALSLMTLHPSQSAPPVDVDDTKETISDADLERVMEAIRILRETKGIGDDSVGRDHVSDSWANAIKTLADIGKPAVPDLVRALDEEERDHPISKLAFALRAIGDPRAAPALIRAIPKTLQPSRSDFGLRVADPELLKFMQQNDNSPGEKGDDFDYNRAFREVQGALHKITKAHQNEGELNFVQKGETEAQTRIARRLYQDNAERWAKWWGENYEKLGVSKRFAEVGLAPLSDDSQIAAVTALPVGPNVQFAGRNSGTIVGAASENKNRCFFDIDTQRQGAWPKEFPIIGEDTIADTNVQKWAREQGYDFVGFKYQPPGYEQSLYCLQPIDAKVWAITPDEQQKLPQAMAGTIPYSQNNPVDKLLPAINEYKGPNRNELGGAAFLFITREGTCGLIRITAQVTSTKVQIGKPSSPEDQYEPVGFFKGAKLSFSLIVDGPIEDRRAVGAAADSFAPEAPPVFALPVAKPVAAAPGGAPAAPLVADPEGAPVDSPADAIAAPPLDAIPPRPKPIPNTVAGRAVNDKKESIAGADVILFRIDRQGGDRKQLAQKKTDADGRFKFENVIDIEKEFPNRKFPSNHELGDELIQGVLRMPGHASMFWVNMSHIVAQRGEYFQFTMQPAAELSGRVAGSDGKPVAGAIVAVHNGFAGYWDGASSARTDVDGKYVIEDAPPFDMAEFKKQFEDVQKKSYNTFSPTNADYTFFSPVTLTVAHPNFATTSTTFDKSPGTKDVQLDPAGVIEGRTVDAQGKPIAGATIRVTSAPNLSSLAQGAGPPPKFLQATARSDADGKFRVATLPPGKYNIGAEAPDLVCSGGSGITTVAGKPTTVPDLKFSPGGIVSIRLVDANTKEPVKLEAGMTATLLAAPVPPQTTGPPLVKQAAPATEKGRFELRTPPGLRMIVVGTVQKADDQSKWTGNNSPPGISVLVTEGQTLEIDVPVIEFAPTGVTGNFQLAPVPPPPMAPVPPASNSEPKPEPKAAPNDPTSTLDDGPPEQGSKFLKNLRAKGAPLLAKMASEHGYGLPDDKDVARVAPPFDPIRMEWYEIANPSQYQAIPRGPDSMLFRWSKGKLQNWGMSFGDRNNPGHSIAGLCDSVLNVKEQNVEGNKDLMEKVVPGDWVVRTGVKKEALIKQLQTILQDECDVPVSLAFREVKRTVWVARGEYEKTIAPAGYRATGKLNLTDETLTTYELQIYGKQLVPNSGSGGGSGKFDEFLNWVGRWIEAPIVSEVTKLPKSQLSWNLHARSPSTKEMQKEDHDPELVLAHITEQTGLTFTKEESPVTILFVEPKPD